MFHLGLSYLQICNLRVQSPILGLQIPDDLSPGL
jgi:hypothetical protein